ncbi:MAG: AAA family ATPase [Bacteroidota bacterium]
MVNKVTPANKINRVITFYSYKGGVGRSMAMANIAVLLAQWGNKTLVIDWDLEAPGLENFYSNYIDPKSIRSKAGLIDLLNLKQTNPQTEPAALNWDDYISTITIDSHTQLDILSAGRNDDNFIKNVKQFDYNNFYQNSDGGQYLEELREVWLDTYDIILIDSRTGLTDSSGICSIQMPDILVLLFTPNEQSFNGIKSVSEKAIKGQKQIIFDRFRLRTLPVPSRIENQETALLDEWMTKIYNGSGDMLEWLPKKGDSLTELIVTPSQLLNLIKIPYKTFYAYGEKLAVVERGTFDTQDIGYNYETLAAVLANDFQDIDLLVNSRDNYVKKAKGEDYTNDANFRRKIEKEQEEKQKLEDQLHLKEKQAKKKSSVYTFVVIGLLLGIAALVYFVLNRGETDTATTTTAIEQSDSLKLKEAYLDFRKAYYNTNVNQLDSAFNSNMIKQYYQLDKNYRDSAVDIKKKIEEAFGYKFTDVIRAYYSALPVNPFVASNFFEDTISIFGTLINTIPDTLEQRVNKAKKITNTIDGNAPFTVTSDSNGFTITFIEKGNFMLDTEEEYKNMENAITAVVSYNYKIKSFSITNLKGTAIAKVGQKTVLEIFLCQTNDNIPAKKASEIINTLQKTNKYTVYTRNNFKVPADTASPYYITKNQIRYNGDEEKLLAKEVKSIISRIANIEADLMPARTPTKNYLSVFICFAPQQIKMNVQRNPINIKAQKNKRISY